MRHCGVNNTISAGNSMYIICQNYQGQCKSSTLRHVNCSFFEEGINDNVMHQNFTKC